MKKSESLTTFARSEVAEAFHQFDAPVRKKLLGLRKLIFATAEKTPGVGPLEETLKWGEPSYLTTKSKSGTTIRISQVKNSLDFALYVSCQTTLIADFKKLHKNTFTYEGKRAIRFKLTDKMNRKALEKCIAMALTYHLGKKRKK